MPDQVNVDDLEVFSRFRAAMLKFAQTASQALNNADSEIARTHSWLESEQKTYWEGQLRKRTEAVTYAREKLRQKKLYKDASGRTPSATEEEKALAKCIAAVEHAHERIESIRRWLPKLEKAAGLYRGGVAPLSKTICDDIPRGVALLDRLAGSLEQYVQIEAAIGHPSESAATEPVEESFAREGDVAPAPPPPPAGENIPPPVPAHAPAPSEPEPDSPTPPEDRNVPDRQ